MQEKAMMGEALAAGLTRNAAGCVDVGAPRFHYAFECRDADGNLKWTDEFDNLVTTAGRTDLVNKYFKGSAYTAAWYLGLKGVGAATVGDTLASHAGWAEVTPYTGNRPAITFGTTSGGSNTATAVSYSITGSATVAGAFIVSANTGTSGVLYSVGDFSAARQVEDGYTMNVTVRVEIKGVTDPGTDPGTDPDPDPNPGVTLPPITKDGTLLRDVAAELTPGEWRRVDTQLVEGFSSFNNMQMVKATPPDTASTDGMGWTERLVEYRGTLMLPLMRDHLEKAMLIMDSAGQWHRIEQPQGWSVTKWERRPFNRWFRDEEYAYFAPADMPLGTSGYTLRTLLESPGEFERFGIPIGDTSMGDVGNFAMCKAWGRFWAHTPGGRLRSWAEGEAGWDNNYSHIPLDQRNSGFAGTVIYNPVRDEVFSIGGQTFGDSADVSYRGLRVRSADARSEAFEARWEDGSPVMAITSGSSRFLHHALTGEYLMLYRNGRMYRSETGEVWRLYEDLTTLKPWGNYELYCPWTYLEGTDVIVMVSHVRGVWLHKLKD